MRQQVGALPIRWNGDEPTILLVTSRETRRWIIPKGWPMRNLSNAKAAAREALEEAGVRGRVQPKPIGSYRYLKRFPDTAEECKLTIYLLEVEAELPTFEEMDERRRAWFTFAEAMDQADDAGLRDILRDLEPRLRSARAAPSGEPEDGGGAKPGRPGSRKAKPDDGRPTEPADAGPDGTAPAAAVADPASAVRAAAKAKPKKDKQKRLRAAGDDTAPRKDRASRAKPPEAATPAAEPPGRKAPKAKAGPADAHRAAAEAAMKVAPAK